MKKLFQKIRRWFDWSNLFENEFDWTQESYDGKFEWEVIKDLYSRND